MKRIVVKTYKWVVSDNFGNTTSFDNRQRAEEYQKLVKRERRVINYIRPKGLTLVVSKDKYALYRVIPAFLGFNGLPYAEVSKEKGREFFMGLSDPLDHYNCISGDMVTILKTEYPRISQASQSGEKIRLWDAKYGNSTCGLILHPDGWTRGALWYNWDGEKFTTNDKKCKITTEDFLK